MNMDTPARSDRPEMEETITCPHCGQVLAATCRICVSCKQAIDPESLRLSQPPEAAATIPQAEPSPPLARFSWRIFFMTLGASWLAVILAASFLDLVTAQLVVTGLVIGTSVWVLWDAQIKRIPKPWRWSAGCILLWAVFFPWYLSRRRTPRASCPSVEGGKGTLLRLVAALLLLLLLGALIAMIKGTPTRP
jgi:hypothetical protein